MFIEGKAFTNLMPDAGTMNQRGEIVARASRPCESCDRETGETPVPLADLQPATGNLLPA
jgi:hypothetical protein